MNSSATDDSQQLMEYWLHLCLFHFSSPHKLRQILALDTQPSGACYEAVHEAIVAAYTALEPRQRALQAPLVEAVLRWQQPGYVLIPLYSPAYPPLLALLPDPPGVIFARGNAQVLALPQIAMVGTRRPSPDGLLLARDFARDLSAAGFAITSGLAYGIDARSHQSVLDHHGITIAVLGSGLENIYPKRHRALAEQIMENGVVISEFLPGTGPADWHFPRRNRIISGLAYGVLVIEAAHRSGSLITARLAGEQGREVFAVPGSIRNAQTQGCHWLLKNGAKLVENLPDILEELPSHLAWSAELAGGTTGQSPEAAEAPMAASLPQGSKKIVAALGFDPVSVAQLQERVGISAAQLMSSLSELELLGIVACDSGAYRRVDFDR